MADKTYKTAWLFSRQCLDCEWVENVPLEFRLRVAIAIPLKKRSVCPECGCPDFQDVSAQWEVTEHKRLFRKTVTTYSKPKVRVHD